jgi:hypothetical protein
MRHLDKPVVVLTCDNVTEFDFGDHYDSSRQRALAAADWQQGRFTPPCAVLWRKTFVQKIGAWAGDLRVNQDGECAPC